VLRPGVLHIGIDDLEGAHEGDTQASHEIGKPCLGVLALGDRRIERLDDGAAVRLRRDPAANEEIGRLLADEVAVPLEVALVDVEAGCDAEEALEPGNAHQRHRQVTFGLDSSRIHAGHRT
jgi:hypothetical protein